MMKWSGVVKQESEGGLGLGDLELKNWAMLAKEWRYGEEKEAEWGFPKNVPRYSFLVFGLSSQVLGMALMVGVSIL